MKLKFRYIITAFLLGFALISEAQIQLKIVLDADGITYKVYLKSEVNYTGSRALITTSQISIAVPHGTGSNRFVVENLISAIPNMRWRLTDRIDAPPENPEKDYLFFNFINNQTPLVIFDILAGQEILLFTFKRNGNCIGSPNLVEAKHDAFYPPNSQNINIGISFSIVGAGGNAYIANYEAPPQIKVLADKMNPCAGEKVNFSVEISKNDPKTKFQWFVENVAQPSATNKTFSYELPKRDDNHDLRISVKMMIDGTSQCENFSTRSQVVLNVKGTPKLDWVEKIENCAILPAKLVVSATQFADLQWEKNGIAIIGEKSKELKVIENGKYQLKATMNGCKNSLEEVEIVGVSQTQNIKVDAGKDTLVLEKEALVLQGKSNGGVSFEWSPKNEMQRPNSLNPTVFPTENTVFKLTAKDINGCLSSDEVSVNVLPRLYIPSGFSPNGDNKNDTWVIQNTEIYPEIFVEIYNRWGEKVFFSEGYLSSWNGIGSNGQKVPPDIYQYRIKTNRKTYSGSLTVLY